VDVAIAPDWDGGLDGERLFAVTGGRDAPEAQQCRVVATASGKDVIPRAEAITRCRLAFVVRTITATP